jgi:hypothetical protein
MDTIVTWHTRGTDIVGLGVRGWHYINKEAMT